MKHWKVFTITALFFVALATTAYAGGGPWTVKIEGNGIVTGPYYDVDEADIGWNFKWNADTGEVKGQVNIVEKLSDGGVRHFKLRGYQVMPVGDETIRPILFNCNTYEVRVQGFDDQGQEIAVHFRSDSNLSYPNTIWYWVMDAEGEGFITNTGDRLLVSNPFWMECN
jgi:hypothetical protein